MPFAPDLVSADGLHHQPQITMAQTLVLGIGTTLGIVIQAIGLWPAMRKVRFRWRWRFDFRPLRLRELGRASVWMLLYVGVSQVALVALLILLNAASENGRNAGITVYNNAFLIFMMAHGIVAVSIMTALMPRLSAAAAEHRFGDVATQFAQGTRLSAVILVPATAAYIALGRPLAITLFEGGNLSHADAVKTGTVIAFAALGLVPFAISQMQLFAFYAMPDTKTPALLNIPVAALRVGLYALFYFALPSTLFAASLMGANTISYVLGAILGYALLRRRVGRLMLGETWRALARLAAAAAAGGVVAWLVVLGCEHVLGDGKAGSAVALVAGAITLGVVYLGAAVVLKANDVTDVIAMVRARLGR
jgi:putative peptidoglycan lipid II flippase